MGAQCCVNRKSSIEVSEKVLSFDPRKNGLAIAFCSLLEDSCIGLKSKLELLYEISQEYAYNHECCFINPEYLQEKFSLIEFQSLGRKFQAGMGLTHAVDKEIQYLIDEYLILDEDNYSVIILLMFGSSLHPFSLKKRSSSEGKAHYIIHDIFPDMRVSDKAAGQSDQKGEDESFKGVICKDIVFNSKEKLQQYLNTVSIYYYSQNPSYFTQKVQLLTFQIMDEKSFTCSESDLSFLHEQEFTQSIDQELNRLSKGNQKRSIAPLQKSSFGLKSHHKSSQVLNAFGEKSSSKKKSDLRRSYAAQTKEQQKVSAINAVNSSSETEHILRTTQDTISTKITN